MEEANTSNNNNKVINSLLSQAVVLPGGRNLNDHPLIIINANLPIGILNDHLDTAVKYVTSIFSAETRNTGFCVIIDAQKTPWRATRNTVCHVAGILKSEAASILVLRPEAFWEKQAVDNCTRTHTDGAPIYIPLCRLHKYVNATHLPQELGGTWVYEHTSWINNRFKVEEFVKHGDNAVIELESLCFRINSFKEYCHITAKEDNGFTAVQKLYDITKTRTQQIIDTGSALVESMEKQHTQQQTHLLAIPQDIIDTKEMINKLTDIIQGKLTVLEDAWIGLNKTVNDIQEVHLIEEGVRQVTNWILGPGELMLNSQQDVGYDVFSAEDFRKHHESLELQCREPYGRYAELLHKLQVLSQNGVQFLQDLNSQKEFMDFVCRSFATRLERRRNILITSVRFFRLVSEYFQTTSSVYEKLITGIDIETFEAAQLTLSELQECRLNIEILEKELVKEGEKLLDLLSMPVKDALGRELPVNYQGNIVNVQEILDMTISRRQLFRDSVELQKLTLQQVAHIHSYENDALLAIQWLNELYRVMLRVHCHVGCSVYEIQIQKEEHQCFQETAKGTFEFGCQLLRAALALRQSCKLPENSNLNLTNTICECWKQLHAVSQEQLTRLRVSAVFHRNVDQYCEELKELITRLNLIDAEPDLTKKRKKLQKVLFNREKILLEVGRMMRLGRLLKTRLRESICTKYREIEIEYGNETAIEAICEKLSKVTELAENLDVALCTMRILESNNVEKLFCKETASLQDKSGSKSSSDSSNKSDDDFHTASECTGTPPSRDSSFHTGSEEGEPWWQSEKAIPDSRTDETTAQSQNEELSNTAQVTKESNDSSSPEFSSETLEENFRKDNENNFEKSELFDEIEQSRMSKIQKANFQSVEQGNKMKNFGRINNNFYVLDGVENISSSFSDTIIICNEQVVKRAISGIF